MTNQLSLFQQGEDLPLFQQAEPEPTTPSGAHARKLQEIRLLREELGKPQGMRHPHTFKGWSQRCRPGAIDRWLRGLKFELAQRDAEKAAKIEAYEAKRQARVDRLHARADRAEAESQQRFAQADKMASVIPMGQPILVGHHSEKADRRYRDRIHQNMRKGLDAQAEAAELRARAEAAERNRAIFSDDPQASEKIQDKIKRLQERQELMKKANRLVRKGDRDGLAELGFSETVINGLFEPDFCGRVGFADYMLKNNGANIRRLKKRLASLEQVPTENTEREQDGYTIRENADEYRVQLIFPGKPPAEVRKRLKAHGFRWAPSQGAWQRHLNNAGRYAVGQFAEWYHNQIPAEGTS